MTDVYTKRWRERKREEKRMEEKARGAIDLFKKAEKDSEKLNRLSGNCEYRKDIPSIPVSHPECTHPDSKVRVCAYLRDCPRRREVD